MCLSWKEGGVIIDVIFVVVIKGLFIIHIKFVVFMGLLNSMNIARFSFMTAVHGDHQLYLSEHWKLRKRNESEVF